MAIPQTQIVPVENRQLADFSPARDAVREMVVRLKAGMKVKDASEYEYIALATMGLAHNLDPFNQECWIIPGNGVMAGIKGMRKAADSQLPPGAFRNPALRLLQHSEYETYAIPEAAELAAICELTRSDATQKWVNQLTELTRIGMPYEEALKTLPHRPVWIGIGIVIRNEKSKMPRIQLVFKRAEADALKKAFNLPFNIDLGGEKGEDYPIEGEYEYGEAGSQDGPSEADYPQAAGAGVGYPTPPEITVPAESPQAAPVSREITFPFPPEKQLADFGKADWAAFWPFIAKTLLCRPSETNAKMHNITGFKTMTECPWTFGELMSVIDTHLMTAVNGTGENG